MSKPVVGFAGMTHLGLVLGDRPRRARASRRSASIRTRDLVARLERGKLPVLEPDLDDLLARQRRRA